MLSAANAANTTQPPNQEPSERYHDVETAGARQAKNTAGGEHEGKAPLALARSDGLSSVAL